MCSKVQTLSVKLLAGAMIQRPSPRWVSVSLDVKDADRQTVRKCTYPMTPLSPEMPDVTSTKFREVG